MSTPVPFTGSGLKSRRSFLQAGLLGMTGLGLHDLLRARAAQSDGRKTSCILVWLVGGQSHLETYDLKPEAPAEFRGPFRPIRTRVPGMDICELMPRQAQLADRFSLIRSIRHQWPGHTDGAQMFLTGHAPRTVNPLVVDADYPDLGCVYKAVSPQPTNGLPANVAVRHELYYTGPAYLGRRNSSFVIGHRPGNPPDFTLPSLTVAPEAMTRLADRLSLRKSFDTMQRGLDSRGNLAAMDDFDREALRLITARDAQRAFDLNREDARTRGRYGHSIFGQGLLLARRLVEAGVGFVSVDGGWFQDVHPVLADNWDDHETSRDIFDAMQRRLPAYDQGVAALIEDIYARGLDRDVLVVVAGEFGRTPLIAYHNGTPGRGHYPGAMTVLLSGGGMRMGQVIGETTSRGESPRTRLLEPADLLATIYNFLGVDPRRSLQNLQGRPIPILPGGEPIRELVV